ncbi:Ribonuclease H [Senna tora]|uniref:Ribonuclease H n=1 Tax=Senna tora TaxID=362788 RepID=A0A834XJS2_9FABA|nr:Ribonuclease H [Senna tora]
MPLCSSSFVWGKSMGFDCGDEPDEFIIVSLEFSKCVYIYIYALVVLKGGMDGVAQWRRRWTRVKSSESRKIKIFDKADLACGTKRLRRIEKVISWSKSDTNRLKVNVDGACSIDGSSGASCGGIMRDEHGRYLVGFINKLCSCDIMQAELLGVYSGMETAWQHDFRVVIVEMDSMVA